MPTSLARKLLICAAVDGLIIQPLAPKGQRASQPVKVKYGDATVSSQPRDQLPDISRPNSSFEAFGIIGLFTVSRLSYLVTITGRQQVAQIRGYPVYVVTDVALTPCTSQTEAESAVRHTSVQIRRAAQSNDKNATEDENSASDTEGDVASLLGHDEMDEVQSDRESLSGRATAADNEMREEDGGEREGRSSIAEDVIKRKGSYGRFAERWFSHRGWVQDQRRNMGISDASPQSSEMPPDPLGKKQEKDDKKLANTVVAETASQKVNNAVSTGESLLPKLLRMAHIWFGTSHSFYFSYDIDITRHLGNKGLSTMGETPLHRTADPKYFWNRHLLKPIAAANEDALLLPLMQGFVGQREFIVDSHPPQTDSDTAPGSMEMNDFTPSASGTTSPTPERQSGALSDLRPSEKKFLITIVSRRSIKRAGLRYLRRGVDDDGYAANNVETEQLLSSPSWSDSKIFSFLQVRGSIPLFFTQSPYSLKPAAVLQHSETANLKALSLHFDQLRKRYSGVQVVNLVEKHGVESVIGEAFERNVEEYNNDKKEETDKVDFEWFDFHSACRGMKFENVSLLIDTLGAKVESWGSTVENPSSDSANAGRGDGRSGDITSSQKGVLRTNCMDCLDRTNVCQSSFAKYMLDAQLKSEGFDMSAQADQTTSWFNTLWADNGDAISKQYASTAAMKGDYTRTRKRDYRGMVNDLGLSLTRFYNGMVNDYFSQAAIDFLLGSVTSMVFEEFEATMMTKDPAVSMAKMRENAIEQSQKIVVENPESEDFIGGWTVLSPHHSDTIKSLPFDEVVLLLTDAALYLCRFDWKLDKVASFERIDLANIVGIKVGTYIISTVSSTQADENKNVGLVITYEPGKDDVKRFNTRSLTSTAGSAPSGSSDPKEGDTAPPASGGILAPIFGSSSPSKSNKQTRPQKKLALKALYAQSSDNNTGVTSRSGRTLNEQEQIDILASEIERQVFIAQPLDDRPADAEKRSIVEREDIISLAEAKKNTGLLETWGHAVKKLVWA
ncbi:putative SAC domain-containing protein [Seiridium unicorne]|uniref:SAC domain-containing protein n=1 Tax=Seiridium unicorne TaxID=138068 RepID=A0ABR2UL81_9PEZI